MTSRKSINVEGLGHGNIPIPTASRKGNFVATGGIRGVDPTSGKMPEDAKGQCALMFSNLRAVLLAAGGTPDDILKVTIWASSDDVRPLINEEWVKMFPDPAARPARHLLRYDLAGGMLVQCDALAVLS